MESTKNNLYETDYQQWAEQQKHLLQSGQLDRLDIKNLLEELGEVGKSNRRSLTSLLKTLLVHLLKYHYQIDRINPDLPLPYNCAEWLGTVSRTRDSIKESLADSPSLHSVLPDSLETVYQQARQGAADELRPYLQKHQKISKTDFPDTCPWTLKQIMDKHWQP